MKTFSIPAGLLALAVGATAQSVTCNRNNCFRQVAATSARPFPSSARADCSRLLVTTVVPCPVTVTAAAQASVVTVTVTDTTSGTTTVTTVTPPPVTATAVETATVTVTITQAAGQKLRRYPFAAGQPQGEIKYVKRQAGCSAQTIRPSSVPAYASACQNPAQYSSACSCNGVTGSMTTLTPVTSTVTTTPVTTATVTATATDLSSATATADPSTVTTTVTGTVTTTSTVAPAQSTCPSYGTIQIGCANNSVCNSTGVCRVEGSENACFYRCINDDRCVAYAYNSGNGNCNTFTDCCP